MIQCNFLNSDLSRKIKTCIDTAINISTRDASIAYGQMIKITFVHLQTKNGDIVLLEAVATEYPLAA
jgi:hypothetical protein